MKPNLKALEKDSLLMLIRSGTNANHARKESLEGGKEAVSIAPERMANITLRVRFDRLPAKLREL